MANDNLHAVLNAIQSGLGFNVIGEGHCLHFLVEKILGQQDAQKIRALQQYIHDQYGFEFRVISGSRGCSRLVFQVNSDQEVICILRACANDPKLLELFKELGGEFKFVTGKPYQTVFSTNKIGFAEAAHQCENYYNEEKKNATSVEVKKAFRSGKVKEIIQEGETIHREADSHDLLIDMQFMENEIFRNPKLDSSLKDRTMLAVRAIRQYLDGKNPDLDHLSSAVRCLETEKNAILNEAPLIQGIMNRVLALCDRLTGDLHAGR